MELSWMSMGLVVLAFLLSKNRPELGRLLGDPLIRCAIPGRFPGPGIQGGSTEGTSHATARKLNLRCDSAWPFVQIRPIILARISIISN